MPLYYAILKHFMNGQAGCAADVVGALEPLYGGYKLLTHADVEEALATAKENGLLDETSCAVNNEGNLVIFYTVNEFGRSMIDRYIGKYDNKR